MRQVITAPGTNWHEPQIYSNTVFSFTLYSSPPTTINKSGLHVQILQRTPCSDFMLIKWTIKKLHQSNYYFGITWLIFHTDKNIMPLIKKSVLVCNPKKTLHQHNKAFTVLYSCGKHRWTNKQKWKKKQKTKQTWEQPDGMVFQTLKCDITWKKIPQR